MQYVQAEHPSPQPVLVHVGDPHFVAEGLLYGETDPQLGLVEVLDAIEASGIGPEAIIFSGDLTDKGSPEAYSSTPGFHHGEVSGDQLRWLVAELETASDDGTLLVIHHPPVRNRPVPRPLPSAACHGRRME